MTKQIEVLDALPGCGKTRAIFEYMTAHQDYPWLYISPMLSEVDNRVPEEAQRHDIDFAVPSTTSGLTKAKQVMEFLQEGRNVACTHELTMHFSGEHIKEIKSKGYQVVCDEELNLIDAFPISAEDVDFLVSENMITKDLENLGRLTFNKPDMSYAAKYGQVKMLCDRGCLYGAANNDNMIVSYLSPDLILASKRFILLTYNFGGSIMQAFLSLHKITHSYLDVPLYRSNQGSKEELLKLLEFVEPPSVKRFLESQTQHNLSGNWWKSTQHKNKDVNPDKVRKLLSSLPKTSSVSKTDMFFTIPMTASNLVKSRDVSLENLVPCNCRATNDFAYKKYAIHAFNLYSNVTVKSYLAGYGYEVDEDSYALNLVIQWLFRGCIRERQPMKVTFLSSRIRGIFKHWLLKR